MIFEPLKFTDFLKEEEDPVSWLVRGLVKKRGYTLISGPPKLARKSMLTKRLGLCVSANRTDGLLEPTMQGRVLCVSEEGTKVDEKNQLLAHCASLGIAPESIDDNFYVGFMTGLRLFLPEHMEQLLTWCDDVKPDLVILDPFSKVGPDDADGTEASLVCMQAVAEMQRRGMAVCIVAHTKKLQANLKMDIDQEIRGSSVLSGAYDTHLALRPTQEGLPIPLTVRNKNAAQKEFKLQWTITEEYNQEAQDNIMVRCDLEWRDK